MLTLRTAEPEDAEPIARVYVNAWRATYPGVVPNEVLVRMSVRAQARQWALVLRQRGRPQAVIVAEDRAAGIIGMGSCGEARATGLPQSGEIYTLYVAPGHQDNGVGSALLSRLFDVLADRGLNSALVWVLDGNPARFFYEAMGGRRVAVRMETLWNKELTQVAYGWDDVRSVNRLRDVGAK
ncbi:MAG: GNAT family N-acetyltransferase [Defluviicoccus sp.]